MEKQSWMSGGKGLALAGGAVAAVVVALGLVFSVRVAPPEAPPVEEAATVPPVAGQNAVTEAVTDAPAPQAVEAGSVDTTPEASPAQTQTDETTVAVDETASSGQEAAPSTDQDATAAPAVDTVDAVTAQPDAAPVTAPVTAQDETRDTVPSFDTVRLAPDGEAVVAGRALAGSAVDILLDGIVVGTAMTGGDGAFAAFVSLPPSDTPRVLTLAISRDGAVVASDQQVIIAPVQPANVDVAAQASAPEAGSGQAAPVTQTASAPSAPAPAVLLSDDSGVRVLQPATPADPSRVGGIALDVISYTSEGDVLLQGRATAAANILIYLDNAPVTSAPVGADGIWSTGLPGVAPGIYTLRLDEVDAAGKVLSRIETPFKREDRDEVAAIAAASAPANIPAQPASSGAGTPAGDAPVTADTAPSTASPTTPTVRVVTVQPGNTLWAIARESYGDGPLFVRVFEANRDRIRDPDLIYPGQIFEIPE